MVISLLYIGENSQELLALLICFSKLAIHCIRIQLEAETFQDQGRRKHPTELTRARPWGEYFRYHISGNLVLRTTQADDLRTHFITKKNKAEQGFRQQLKRAYRSMETLLGRTKISYISIIFIPKPKAQQSPPRQLSNQETISILETNIPGKAACLERKEFCSEWLIFFSPKVNHYAKALSCLPLIPRGAHWFPHPTSVSEHMLWASGTCLKLWPCRAQKLGAGQGIIKASSL